MQPPVHDEARPWVLGARRGQELPLRCTLGVSKSHDLVPRTLKLLQREQNHSNAEDARFFGEASRILAYLLPYAPITNKLISKMF